MKKIAKKQKKFWWCLVDQKEKHYLLPDHVFQAWKNWDRFVLFHGPWYVSGRTEAHNALMKKLHPEFR